MKFYVQTDNENRITDVIEYPHGDYKPVEWAAPLPPNILARVYELVDGQAVYHPEWDTPEPQEVTVEEIAALNARVDYIGMMTEVM